MSTPTPSPTATPSPTQERLELSLRTAGLAALAADFVDARSLSDNHLQLADTLAAAAGESNPQHVLIAALALSAQERGHSALSLRPDLLPRMVPARPSDPNTADARTAALAWPPAGQIATSALANTAPPLLQVRTGTHLGTTVQTHRLSCEEQWVADRLLELSQPVAPSQADFLRLTPDHRALAKHLFDDDKHPAMGAFDALMDGRLAIITGGPGTGKTWSIKRILAVFHAATAHRGSERPFTVALAAPTGKAGVRMREAIREDLDKLQKTLATGAKQTGLALDAKAICGQLETHGSSTLHRLLGIRPGEGSARHNTENPLTHDLVVVDEASMADLPMMRRLLQAIGPTTRLVLLGDRDQLPSVDVGAVLSDLVSPALRQQASPLQVSRFVTNHRSKHAKTLADLVTALQSEGGLEAAMAILMMRHTRGAEHAEGAETLEDRIRRLAPPLPPTGGGSAEHSGSHADLVKELLKPWTSDRLEKDATPSEHPGYVTVLANLIKSPKGWRDRVHQQAEALFAAFDAYRILAVHRRGPLGVAGLSRPIEKRIRQTLTEAWAEQRGTVQSSSNPPGSVLPKPVLPSKGGKWLGQAILITCNDADLGVYNGDVGLVLPMPRSAETGRSTGTLALALPRISDPSDPEDAKKGPIRYIALSRLPEHESAFVMTVHKSQGSQFDHTAVVLADRPSTIQTRELVYTGITRAKERVTWVGTEASMRAALETRVLRGSLLEERITGQPAPAVAERVTASVPASSVATSAQTSASDSAASRSGSGA